MTKLAGRKTEFGSGPPSQQHAQAQFAVQQQLVSQASRLGRSRQRKGAAPREDTKITYIRYRVRGRGVTARLKLAQSELSEGDQLNGQLPESV